MKEAAPRTSNLDYQGRLLWVPTEYFPVCLSYFSVPSGRSTYQTILWTPARRLDPLGRIDQVPIIVVFSVEFFEASQ